MIPRKYSKSATLSILNFLYLLVFVAFAWMGFKHKAQTEMTSDKAQQLWGFTHRFFITCIVFISRMTNIADVNDDVSMLARKWSKFLPNTPRSWCLSRSDVKVYMISIITKIPSPTDLIYTFLRQSLRDDSVSRKKQVLTTFLSLYQCSQNFEGGDKGCEIAILVVKSQRFRQGYWSGVRTETVLMSTLPNTSLGPMQRCWIQGEEHRFFHSRNQTHFCINLGHGHWTIESDNDRYALISSMEYTKVSVFQNF